MSERYENAKKTSFFTQEELDEASERFIPRTEIDRLEDLLEWATKKDSIKNLKELIKNKKEDKMRDEITQIVDDLSDEQVKEIAREFKIDTSKKSIKNICLDDENIAWYVITHY